MKRTFSDTAGDFAERVGEAVSELFRKAGCSLKCVKINKIVSHEEPSSKIDKTYSRQTDSELFATVHNDTLIRLVEDIGESRADIVE